MSQFENPAPTGQPSPTTEPRLSDETTRAAAPRDRAEQWDQQVPGRGGQVPPAPPRGPTPFPIVLGLMCLTVAGLVFTAELSDWDVNWLIVVPVGLVTTGALLVLAGLLGLVANRPGRS